MNFMAEYFQPRDPSLETRPIPSKRSFDICAFGPGADPAIQRTARSVSDVDLNIRPSDYSNNPEFDSQVFERERPFMPWVRDEEDWLGFKKRTDDVRKLLSAVQAYRNSMSGLLGSEITDPTWGYYIFVTSYTDAARQKLDAAVEALVQLTLRSLRRMSPSLYSEEASKRFKLDVIQNKEALENASEDRVREEFRAQLRGSGMLEDDIMFRGIGSSRCSACILLDEDTIKKLSKMPFSLDTEQDDILFGDVYVRLIDPKWDYPAQPHPGTIEDGIPYRGADDCPVTCLAELYRRMDGDMMEDYPMADVMG
ncbi:hypothetical protein FSPOR_5422 [Fusarium sporotrichioides]|uniref:Uncharacterized protein n=1 Tax=Fusarium sporotrichioides TaxID=5514 RepID=A0A395S7B6_FUSSP|nr:hypothetical protein FSPOR_5422 [Fusarium sporotrichioides]